MKPNRCFAVDWSGAKEGAQRKIWVCEVARGEVLRLENGRSREQVADLLVEAAEHDPRFVVGLDFAFSFPQAFLRKRAHRSAKSVWSEAERLGEKWLAHSPFPFWGKPGTKKPLLGESLFRATELEVAAASGRRPSSVFQTGGAGAVGVGSIRGMPILSRLRSRGFSVWPFHEARLPLVIEVWPRLSSGPVNKSDAKARVKTLRARFPGLPRKIVDAARGSDDAFDALITALDLDAHRRTLARLERAPDRQTCLEGRIWQPSRPVGRT